MDMLMVDVTEINCTEGDSVIILWKPNRYSLKAKHDTYEVLTSSQRKESFYR
jgi:alanine racemase